MLCPQYNIFRLFLPSPSAPPVKAYGSQRPPSAWSSVTVHCVDLRQLLSPKQALPDRDGVAGQWVRDPSASMTSAVGITSVGLPFEMCLPETEHSSSCSWGQRLDSAEPSPQPCRLNLSENPSELIEMVQRKFPSASKPECSKDLRVRAGERASPFLTKAWHSDSLKRGSARESVFIFKHAAVSLFKGSSEISTFRSCPHFMFILVLSIVPIIIASGPFHKTENACETHCACQARQVRGGQPKGLQWPQDFDKINELQIFMLKISSHFNSKQHLS